MRTMKMHSLTAVLGLVLAPALASAADGAAPDPAAPAATSTDPAQPAGAPAPAAAAPADTGAADAAPASAAAPSKLINIDVEAASAYVWRGLNLYGEETSTQNFSLFPSATATFGGFSVGYFGGFQLTGDNKSALVDSGTGAEQDLILKFAGAFNPKLTYSAGLVTWFYPFVDPDVAPVDLPIFMEPGISLGFATAVDLNLYVGYYFGLQSETDAGNFVYISPSVGKSLELSPDIDLALGLSAGYKIYPNLPDGQDPDKAFDLTLNVGTTLPFSDMYITPQVHAAMVTRANDDAEFVAWAGVHVGYNIGL
jgi:hypothetical protein